MIFPQALELLKARLGISTMVRDEYLTAILKSVEDELMNNHGLKLKPESYHQLMFVVDYAEYRYSNREDPTFPRHLQWRLHNLTVGKAGEIDGRI